MQVDRNQRIRDFVTDKRPEWWLTYYRGEAMSKLILLSERVRDAVNENRKHDAAYRDAYASCLRARGYRA